MASAQTNSLAAPTNRAVVLVPPPSGSNAAPTELRGVKPPVPLPGSWLWLAVALGAVLLALVALYLYLRWRRPRRSVEAPALVIPPHTRARNALRRALDRLREPDPFCSLVSGTLRVYLEERFELRAPERTTEEFLEELQTSPQLTLTQKQSLADFLSRCDLVKFARHEPGEAELRDLWDAALRLVDETAPDTLASGASPSAAGETPAPAPHPLPPASP